MAGMRPKTRAAMTSAVAALILLSACSVDGHAVNDSDPAASAAIDVKSLDTGKYPTEPRKPFGKPTVENVLQYEGQRMAQFIVAPFEIDRDLTQMGLPTQMLFSRSSNVKAVVGEDVGGVPANENVFYGYVASASTPDSMLRTGTKRSLNNMVARYLTAADATAAANQMADVYGKRPKTTPVRPAGLSGSRVLTSPGGEPGNTSMASFTAHGTYVLVTSYTVDDAQKDMLEPAISKAVNLQSALIDQFPAAPTKEEAAAHTRPSQKLLMDQSRVLIYALPYSDKELEEGDIADTNMGNVRAVYGPRAMSFRSDDPPGTFALLNETGSTANAVERSTVYRAKTADGAKKIMDTLATGNKTRGRKSQPAPPNLPGARCAQEIARNLTQYWCEVQVGRYVGEVFGDELKDVYQQASAQYVILTKADQNAN